MKLNIRSFTFYLQRTIKSYSLREFISQMQAKFIGKSILEGPSALGVSDEADHIAKLRKDGFTEFNSRVSEDCILKITEETRDLLLFDPFNRKIGNFHLGDIPAQTHVANFSRADLVQNEVVLRIANDPGILRIVQEFLGATPTISNINMWWSIAGKSQARDAQLFHRDVDDVKFCKLFIYLTDVGVGDGPHTYVKGSSSANKLTEIRRYEDREIENVFGKENIINFCRPKGAFFIVDTYGFHKGTLPVENNRLLLQIQYSLNPIGIENYRPITSSYLPNRYINRLLIK